MAGRAGEVPRRPPTLGGSEVTRRRASQGRGVPGREEVGLVVPRGESQDMSVLRFALTEDERQVVSAVLDNARHQQRGRGGVRQRTGDRAVVPAETIRQT